MKRRQEIVSKPDTRGEIVALADVLIRRRGYNAFSYSDLGGMLDVRPAAIHYHFRSKADLGEEVVRQEQFRLQQFRVRNERQPGEEQLKHLFTIFYRNSFLSNACLMGSLLPEYATFGDPIREALQALGKDIWDWVSYCLEDARASGRLHFQGTAADRALLVVSTLLSSLLLARIHGATIFERIADQQLHDLGADWRVADLHLSEGEADWLEEPHSFS